jgi:hypothetical protein
MVALGIMLLLFYPFDRLNPYYNLPDRSSMEMAGSFNAIYNHLGHSILFILRNMWI